MTQQTATVYETELNGQIVQVRRFPSGASSGEAVAVKGMRISKTGRITRNGEKSERRQWKGTCLLHTDTAEANRWREAGLAMDFRPSSKTRSDDAASLALAEQHAVPDRVLQAVAAPGDTIENDE